MGGLGLALDAGLGLDLDLMQYLRLGADQHQRLFLYLGLDLDLGLAGPRSDLARGRAVLEWCLGRFGSDPKDPVRIRFGLVWVSSPDLVAAFLRPAGLIERWGRFSQETAIAPALQIAGKRPGARIRTKRAISAAFNAARHPGKANFTIRVSAVFRISGHF